MIATVPGTMPRGSEIRMPARSGKHDTRNEREARP